MIEISGMEYYEELRMLLDTQELTLPAKYRRLRALFERLCKQVTFSQSTQFPNLFSRLGWIIQHRLSSNKQLAAELNALRVRMNHLTDDTIQLSESDLKEDILTVALGVRQLLIAPFPDDFHQLEQQVSRHKRYAAYQLDTQMRMRARFVGREQDTLCVIPDDNEDGQSIRVTISREHSGQQLFAETLDSIHEGAQLNLLQVRKNIKDGGQDTYTAEMVVLEPDFLLDISAVAECFREYGHHPLNYFMSRLLPDISTHYILLGNIANQFLDDLINQSPSHPADYLTSMSKAFRQSPVSIAACADLEDEITQAKFFEETYRQFQHIRQVVESQFPASGIHPSKALLEPSFVCEALGLQGRLDLLLDDYSRFVELKSGKAQENFFTKEISHRENHYVQMMLYYAVLQFNLGRRPEQIQAFLFYSKYPYLFSMAPYWGLVKQALNVRNQIVELEYRLQQHNDPQYSKEILTSINSQTLNVESRADRLWRDFLRPQIDAFSLSLSSLSSLESEYFHTLFTFIIKEEYTAKAGDTEMEFNKGVTSLWDASLQEKQEAGEIICDMELVDSQILADSHLLTFELSSGPNASLPNYRTGDSVMLYRRNTPTDLVTNHQVFKASVDYIDSRTLRLSLRAIQKNQSVLPLHALYAVERDYMDVAYLSMLKGLGAFMHATPERVSLLLGQRKPRVEYPMPLPKDDSDVERVVSKAVAAQDYFLLVGPPGTGKTSCALRRMVESFYEEPQTNILLLAYTNRAVDEICHALYSIDSNFPFLRIGMESSCEELFKPRLLRNVMADCLKRTEVRRKIDSYRVFVGTVSSFSRQTELFRLKHFDVAIIDEASQILEPQLLGLLCATDAAGKDAIRKFILIGDYKQLPAVVVQSDESAEVRSEALRKIGMRNLKESLFERLYRWEQACGRSDCCDMLTRQGRMHPQIGDFPARYFYQGLLKTVPLKHQLEVWSEVSGADRDFELFVRTKRFGFFPVAKSDTLSSNKSSREEAVVVASVIACWLRQQLETRSEVPLAKEVGVITPYRSQIAMIRKELQARGIPDADTIVIDTVERFQGGQRNLMIYSCCMNAPYQLNFLSNTMEEEGILIDRKLNVALTRARLQMFVVGNPVVLKRDPIYFQLLTYFKEHHDYFLGAYSEEIDGHES